MGNDKNRIKLNEVFMNDDLYNETISNLETEILKEDFSKRNNKVFVKELKQEITKSRLLTILIMGKHINIFKKEIDYSNDLFLDDIGKKSIANYFNKVINTHVDDLGSKFNQLRDAISWSIHRLSVVSGTANFKIGNTISLYSIIKAGLKNKKIIDIISGRMPEGITLFDVEKVADERMNELTAELGKDPDNCLYNFINSGCGINPKQFEEVFVSLGVKADIYGNIIPEIIDTNLVNGFRNVKDFYINSISARKALILSFSNVKESGYLTRKLSLLQIDNRTDPSFERCDTKHFLKVSVFNKNVFENIIGRIMVNPDGTETLITKKHSDIIGTEIMIRSPITCNGKFVCKSCYGPHITKLNQRLHTGILSVLILTNQLTQRLLSAKHLLSTKTKKINWSENFKEIFQLDRNIIKRKKEDYFISFKLIKTDATENGEELIKVNKFTIHNKEFKEVVNYGINFIPTPELLNFLQNDKLRYLKKDDVYTIYLGNLKDMNLFYINIENNELNHVLKHILHVLENNKYLSQEKFQDYNFLFNYMTKILNEANIKLYSSHLELIIRGLLKNGKNINKNLKWNKKKLPKYKIVRVSNAIINSRSVANGLVFERIKNQFTDINTYKKNRYSIVDKLIK